MFNKIKYLLDIPKTILFNFRALPFKEALRLPFFVGHSYKIKVDNYKNFVIDVPSNQRHPFMIRFVNGGSIDVIPNKHGIIALNSGGKVIFEGDCQFSAGCSIRVSGGKLTIGNSFSANRNCNISCVNQIKIGDLTLFGFNVSVRDSDGHTIIRSGMERINNKPILIGTHVWICANSSISKGVEIGDNSIVSTHSNLHGVFPSNSLIVGTPGRVVDTNVNWKL